MQYKLIKSGIDYALEKVNWRVKTEDKVQFVSLKKLDKRRYNGRNNNLRMLREIYKDQELYEITLTYKEKQQTLIYTKNELQAISDPISREFYNGSKSFEEDFFNYLVWNRRLGKK